MPKFLASCFVDIRDIPERIAGRVARNAAFIVAAEADDGSWAELDAEDVLHARRLCYSWVDDMSARGCSVWAVTANGMLAKRNSFSYFANEGFADEPQASAR